MSNEFKKYNKNKKKHDHVCKKYINRLCEALEEGLPGRKFYKSIGTGKLIAGGKYYWVKEKINFFHRKRIIIIDSIILTESMIVRFKIENKKSPC